MPGGKISALFALAVIGSASAYCAHFIGGQIAYLHEKLSPPVVQLKLTPNWPGSTPSLPAFGDLPKTELSPERVQSKY